MLIEYLYGAWLFFRFYSFPKQNELVNWINKPLVNLLISDLDSVHNDEKLNPISDFPMMDCRQAEWMNNLLHFFQSQICMRLSKDIFTKQHFRSISLIKITVSEKKYIINTLKQQYTHKFLKNLIENTRTTNLAFALTLPPAAFLSI